MPIAMLCGFTLPRAHQPHGRGFFTLTRGGGAVPRAAHNRKTQVRILPSLPVIGGRVKYCQQTRVGGRCGAEAAYQAWRGRKGRGTKRFFCARCLNALTSTPAQRDKIIAEEIA